MIAAALPVNAHGKRLFAATLHRHFNSARAKAVEKNPIQAADSKAFGFMSCEREQQMTHPATRATSQLATYDSTILLGQRSGTIFERRK